MSTNGHQSPGVLMSLERDGQTYSALAAGIRANSFAIRSLSPGKRESGWLVRGEVVTEWEPRGLAEHEGKLYLLGPFVEGRYLEATIFDESRDRLEDIARVASALDLMMERGIETGPLNIRSIVLLDDGGVLFAPPEIAESIEEHVEVAEQLRIARRYRHPDRPRDENAGFFLAALLYYVATGVHAFDAQTMEELHARIRAGKPVRADYRDLELKPEVAQLLHETLSGSRYQSSPGAWAETIDRWRAAGITRVLSEDERAELRVEADEAIGKLERGFDRSETIRRNWRRWAIIAGATILVLVVPATILRNSLRPRATAGYSPAQVVEAFYTSVNTLDHITMEDAVVDDAGRSLIREVTNLYVIDRQRLSVEFQSAFIDVQQWLDDGAPEPGNSRVPYGVVDLTIEALPATGDEQAFRASYYRFLPAMPEDPEGPPPARPYEVYEAVDLLRLRLDRDDWVIYEIVQEQFERLAASAVDQLIATAPSPR